MSTSRSDRLLSRGIWCLVVGVFTSWLFGIGLLFIAAAAAFGIVGLFGERIGKSAILLTSSLVLGFVSAVIALHVTAIAGIYAFNALESDRPESRAGAVSIVR